MHLTNQTTWIRQNQLLRRHEVNKSRHDRAERWIRAMRGGSQSHLLLSVRGQLLVVKFSNNPQHARTLANEYIVSRMCKHLGLCVPEFSIVKVDDELIDATRELTLDYGSGKIEKCCAGLHFGSYHIGLLPGRVSDLIEPKLLQTVPNLHQFWGMLVLDKWTANTDKRQAVFQKRSARENVRVAFIDHGHSFNGGNWSYKDIPQLGTYPVVSVYSNIRGWKSFEPWLSQIENFDPQTLYEISREVPAEWYSNDSSALDALLEELLGRRGRVIALIDALRKHNGDIFPKWQSCFTWSQTW